MRLSKKAARDVAAPPTRLFGRLRHFAMPIGRAALADPAGRIFHRAQLKVVSLLPVHFVVSDEITPTRPQEAFRRFETWGNLIMLAQGQRGLNQPAASLDDHQITGPEMLPGMVGYRTHAFGDGLILKVDSVETGIAACTLYLAVNLVVVARIGR